jgi:hypothetical protein
MGLYLTMKIMSKTQAWLDTLDSWSDEAVFQSCPVSGLQIKPVTGFPQLRLLALHRNDLTHAHPCMYTEWNGILIDIDSKKVVSYGCPLALQETVEHRLTWTAEFLQQCSVQPFIDGSAFKLSWIGGKWVLSSEKFAHAHERRWIGQRSLGDLFDEAWGEASYEDLLGAVPDSRQYTHVFLMMHPQHRHVVPCNQPTLRYVGSRDLRTFEWVVLETIPFFVLPTVHDIVSAESIVQYLSHSNWMHPGLRIYHKETDSLLQIDNPDFLRVASLKGNTVHMIQHVLQMVLHAFTTQSILSWSPGLPGEVQSIFEAGVQEGVNVMDLHLIHQTPQTDLIYFLFYFPEYLGLAQHLYRFVNAIYLDLNSDERIANYKQCAREKIHLSPLWYHFLKSAYLPGHTSRKREISRVVLPPMYWNSKQVYDLWRLELERGLSIPHHEWSQRVAVWNQATEVPADAFPGLALPLEQRVHLG